VNNTVWPITPEMLVRAASLVHAGGVIAFPTDTFYALGVTPFNAAAVRRIFTLKGRGTSPILVLIRDPRELEGLVADITPSAQLLMNACWPGPLTIVFRACPSVPSLVGAETGTIGIRLAAADSVQQLLDAVGGPLTGTSANRTGAAPPTTAQEVDAGVGAGVDLILDGGPTAGGLPSTVVDTTVLPIRLIREGAVPRGVVLSIVGTLAA
jgi:L-threonylcarbamoyladenylate synthase